MIETLNKKIIGKMGAIKRGSITAKESKIGLLFNQLKSRDEALYTKLIIKYKTIIQEIDK